MSKPLPAKIEAGVGLDQTRPLFFVEIGFDTPLRLCSREALSVGGVPYEWASFEYRKGSNSFKLINEDLKFTQFLTEGAAGKTFKAWMGYGEPPFSSADLILDFDGELGSGERGSAMVYALRPHPPKRTPRLLVAPPLFNHLPPDGLEIQTAEGVYVMERQR